MRTGQALVLSGVRQAGKSVLQAQLRAAALPGTRRPLVLTLDQRDRVTVDGMTVDVIPVWKWLTSPPEPSHPISPGNP